MTVVLHLIDAISCTTADCLIWDFNLSEGDAWYKIFFWLSLLIVVPMFVYGIFKSVLLYKILMLEIVAVNKYWRGLHCRLTDKNLDVIFF